MATNSVAAASHDEFHRNSLFDLKGRVALVTGKQTQYHAAPLFSSHRYTTSTDIFWFDHLQAEGLESA